MEICPLQLHFNHSAKKNTSSSRGGEKEGGFGEAMRNWKEGTEVGVEKEENVRKLVRQKEITTSRNSKETKRNGTGQGKVNEIREMFRRMEGQEKKNDGRMERRGWRRCKEKKDGRRSE